MDLGIFSGEKKEIKRSFALSTVILKGRWTKRYGVWRSLFVNAVKMD